LQKRTHRCEGIHIHRKVLPSNIMCQNLWVAPIVVNYVGPLNSHYKAPLFVSLNPGSLKFPVPSFSRQGPLNSQPLFFDSWVTVSVHAP